MQIHTKTLNALAQRLTHERQLQGLSREQLAAVCNVSSSFIRDAESNPGRCSLELMLQLTEGLGLKATLSGWQNDGRSNPPTDGPSEAPPA
ncbi:helix-turn-helix domain-containing protein [Polaromonas sp. AER18D-145]|uniref:helix-turn-helix domain-containing protein n=1 Tax=Polaromonas sp. AER18D-145 TaxID=1977060 RepID=UPI000BBCB93B|nr:helix-turn-helix transcriptional regulator [Polaromonas sp. AER18D-145]